MAAMPELGLGEGAETQGQLGLMPGGMEGRGGLLARILRRRLFNLALGI